MRLRRSRADAARHLQEVIVQNFRAKPGTRMADAPEPPLEEHLWTIAAARLLLPPEVSVQAPPNLAYEDFPRLLDAGIDDWGGVSPVTIDHVNPEAPWPELERLAAATGGAGSSSRRDWPCTPVPRGRVARPGGAARGAARVGLARARARGRLAPGRGGAVRRSSSRATRFRWPPARARRGRARPPLPRPRRGAPARVRRGRPAAPRGRRRRGQLRRHAEHPVHERLLLPLRLLRLLEGQARGEPARRAVPRPARRDRAAGGGGVGARRDRGLPPGRDPSRVHRRLLRVGRRGAGRELPGLHVHAFSALEVWQGAATLGVPLATTSRGCATRGSARSRARPPRSSTTRCARSSARTRSRPRSGSRCTRPRTGRAPLEHHDHVRPRRAAAALGAAPPAVRELQQRTGGFTEFVPLPFVHMEAPICLKGRARRGRRSARCCSCTRSPGSRSIRGSRTCRPRG